MFYLRNPTLCICSHKIPLQLNFSMGTRACRMRSIQPVCSRRLSSFLDSVLSRSALPPFPMSLTDFPTARLQAWMHLRLDWHAPRKEEI